MLNESSIIMQESPKRRKQPNADVKRRKDMGFLDRQRNYQVKSQAMLAMQREIERERVKCSR